MMSINENTPLIPNTSHSGMVSAFWLWLKICVSWVWPAEYIHEVEYEYYDDPHTYTENRHRRRFAHKTLPAERYSTFYYAVLSKHYTRAQFIERAARLSVKGRRKYYGTLSHSPRRSTKRMQFRVLGAAVFVPPSANAGLWQAHLWPS